MESILGVQAPCLVPSVDSPLNHCCLRDGLVRCRSGAQFDESAPRYWSCYLCSGYIPSLLGLAGPQDRKQTETIPRPAEASCMFRPASLAFWELNFSIDTSMAWPCAGYLGNRPDPLGAHPLWVAEIAFYRVCNWGLCISCRPLCPVILVRHGRPPYGKRVGQPNLWSSTRRR